MPTIDNLDNDIGLCSEIINLATKITNPRMRNTIMKNVGTYRKELREDLDRVGIMDGEVDVPKDDDDECFNDDEMDLVIQARENMERDVPEDDD